MDPFCPFTPGCPLLCCTLPSFSSPIFCQNGFRRFQHHRHPPSYLGSTYWSARQLPAVPSPRIPHWVAIGKRGPEGPSASVSFSFSKRTPDCLWAKLTTREVLSGVFHAGTLCNVFGSSPARFVPSQCPAGRLRNFLRPSFLSSGMYLLID